MSYIAIKDTYISPSERSMLCDAKSLRQERKIKFDSFFFEAERIEDADGRVFVRERTCSLVCTLNYDDGIWYHELSCGHDVDTLDNEPPSYCHDCGAKVVEHEAE